MPRRGPLSRPGGMLNRGHVLEAAGVRQDQQDRDRAAAAGAGPRGPGGGADRQGRGAAHRRVGGFHRRAGVRRFLVYDNGGRDATHRHPARGAARGGADHRALGAGLERRRLGREIHNQVLAYAHAASNFGGAFRWMAFIDADEFLVPKQAATSRRRWRISARREPVAAVAHVRAVGASGGAGGRGAAELPAAGARSDERGARGAGVQVIVDPCHLTALRVHSMETDGSGRTCNDAGVAVEEKEREKPGFYSAAHLQLNHYYTRSEAELAAKIGRGPNLAAKRGSTSEGAADGGEHRGRRGRGPGGARLPGADRLGGA